ncbi:MAG: PIN domain-containing protein, partial [Novosphingobium sp.]
LVAPVQALGETFVVLRRSGIPASEARAVVIELAQGLATAGSSESTLNAALDLVAEHKLQFWDAMIVSAAAETGCSLLLSEDMQDGFVVRGLTIANPLTDRPHQKLARLLA